VLDRTTARFEREGIDRKVIQLVLQAIDQADYEVREKGARAAVPLGETVQMTRHQVDDRDEWLLEIELSPAGKLVAIEQVVAGAAERSDWVHVP